MRATVALIGTMAAASAFAATTYTWDGGAGTRHLTDAENWSADVLPDTATKIPATIAITEAEREFDLAADFAPYMLFVTQTGEYPGRSVIDLKNHALTAINSKAQTKDQIMGSTDANFKPSAKDLWILNGSLDFYKLHHQANSCTTYSNVTLKVRNTSGSYFLYPGATMTFFDSSFDSECVDQTLRSTSDGASIHFVGVNNQRIVLSCAGTSQAITLEDSAKCPNGAIYFNNDCQDCSLILKAGAAAKYSSVRTASKTTVSGAIRPLIEVNAGAVLTNGNWSGTYAFIAQNGRVVLSNGKIVSNGAEIGYYATASGCGVEFNGDDACIRDSNNVGIGHASNATPCYLDFTPGATGFNGAAPFYSAKTFTIADNVIVKVDATEFLKGRVGSKSNPTVRPPLARASTALACNVEALAANAELTPADGQLVVVGKILYAEFPLPKPGLTVIVR